jgi:probable DNA metabolism protein
MLSLHKEFQLRVIFYKKSQGFNPNLLNKVLAQAEEKGMQYILSNISDEAKKFYKGARAAMCECHQAKGFLRFQEHGDLLIAKAEFEHNIIDSLMRHFMDRFPMKKVVILSDGKAHVGEDSELREEVIGKYLPLMVSEKKEKDELWETFYDSQYIESRRNRKLAMKSVPKKYWKQFDMPEALKIDKGIPQVTLASFI